ncbi:hypothetical protein LCGC14_0194900 [marine sediment metagenome]|uniref:Uncharacterized protein n=1 Tax=marine sediment metagenome TaxID=412755 RepID=A0A0F9XN83_9ZZZZ
MYQNNAQNINLWTFVQNKRHIGRTMWKKQRAAKQKQQRYTKINLGLKTILNQFLSIFKKSYQKIYNKVYQAHFDGLRSLKEKLNWVSRLIGLRS